MYSVVVGGGVLVHVHTMQTKPVHDIHKHHKLFSQNQLKDAR